MPSSVTSVAKKEGAAASAPP